MRQTKLALALLTAAVLTACGGTSPAGGDQTQKLTFTQQVSFGDSLSDVGTYAVGAVKQAGGGKFTINGDATNKNPELNGKIWVEFLAAELKLPAPCAAQTGLQGNAAQGFSVPIVNNLNCFNYAQGGSRVTNPVGPGNAATGSPIGEMTVPLVTQVANHLSRTGNKFSGTELVTILSGGNDVLMSLTVLQNSATAAGSAAGAQAFGTSLTMQLAAGATNPQTAAQAIGAAIAAESARPGNTSQTIVAAAVGAAARQPGNAAVAQASVYGPMVAKAQADATAAGNKAGADYLTANGPKLVQDLGLAGAQMATLVKNEIVGKGAKYVVVANLPDVASTPAAKSKTAEVQQLTAAMVNAFNTQLKNGLGSDDRILYVDLYTVSNDQVKNPAPYGLTNTSTPACGPNPLGTTSLICTNNNTVAGDVSHYMFADEIHPTPFENNLVARYVLKEMAVKGWL
ncbi:SGNH/GDSL hydrolase family protein [Massilia sp. IC2-477]|uniref:SGNH/GDSL hydrolase family protein n=1 Tax=unclassified Massilia TaxID=2609279 RepID=UPI001D12F9C2|nr:MULTISPECIES: SGNH/GDSL hydrolase family protein [unclassified Massilia]MCC2956909.1 SGNH/GDSL hydrolase family protein [Massilia sp. IC2-477]MCC2973330.1 SGNH/GDSL hydrolase family protein [Massilia sp. IC2-476]